MLTVIILMIPSLFPLTISLYTAQGVYCEIYPSLEGNTEVFNFNIPLLRMIYCVLYNVNCVKLQTLYYTMECTPYIGHTDCLLCILVCYLLLGIHCAIYCIFKLLFYCILYCDILLSTVWQQGQIFKGKFEGVSYTFRPNIQIVHITQFHIEGGGLVQASLNQFRSS